MALVAALVLGMLAVSAIAKDDRTAERHAMVDQIQQMALSLGNAALRSKLDPRVLAALRSVPRHAFVPAEVARLAYANQPLPIGFGQTISQPFIVALMSDLLQLKASDRVLEIGTGSGYQAAVLSLLAHEVYSIEIVAPLGASAASTLARLGYANVTVRIGDGYEGWEARAPFDAIMVTAAASHVPPALIAQLKPGGRLVIPVGGMPQELMLVVKSADGTTTSTRIVPVLFVPLVRKGAPN
ncbi:MAG: protein-L-isoaspartate(D-aspartate) O-methyltransferase [Hyphomonadaceae bacterium]|jgi:protein-L-isoaspartate(D-aspartate) O-methyltransferase|nr:protein-L-isoaspartate(D-aspartate) O-methyltransferase [Hyphomonadaceae bacterium]